MTTKTRLIPVLLLAALLPLFSPADTEGDYQYTVTDDQATIIVYFGSGGAVSIPHTLGGYPVIAIGHRSFEERSLTSVTIPDSVTSIGSSAFRRCTALTSVTIPDSVTSIGESAFSLCSSLTYVTIPDSVTQIGNLAFVNCSSLTALHVDPANPTFASTDGILFNKALTTLIHYPAGLSGPYTIPVSVTSIGGYAFFNCPSLTSVTIPDSVTDLGPSAFYYCTALTSVTIPDSVTSIGRSAFSYCSSLTSVTIPDSVTSIEDSTFSDCTAITSVIIPGSVTSIGERSFYRCSSLTSVTIPDSVVIIGNFAFNRCYALTSVKIGHSVTSIGYYAFSECSALTSVNIPDSVTVISYYAFSWCTSLASVTIPDSVTVIGDNVFRYCSALTSVLFTGDAPSTIVSTAFDSTPATVFYLPGTAGWGPTCAGHTTKPLLTYSSSGDRITITGIDTSYTGYYLPIPATIDGLPVTSIGGYAFSGCAALTSVNIPDSVVYLYDHAFEYTGLTDVLMGNSVIYIGSYAFYNCGSLRFIAIPDSVKYIGSGAFSCCYDLAEVILGQGVTSIESDAFADCVSLTQIKIPASVDYISSYAFSGCTSLQSVCFDGNAPTMGFSVFSSAPTTLYYLPANAASWSSAFTDNPAVLWNPVVSPAAPLAFTSGQFGFTLTGNANIPVRIQACDNLASPSWSTVASTTLNASGTLSFSDPVSSSAPSRFYRITFPQ